jgi:DNA-binding SARP family transcriptional activator
MAVQPFDPVAAREHVTRAFEQFREAGERDGMLRCWSALVESMFLAWDKFQHIDPWIAWLDGQSHAPLLSADPALELQVASTMTAALTMRGGAPEKMRYWAERALRALAAVKALPLRLGAILYCTNYVAWVRPLDLDTTLLEISLRDAEQAALPPLLRLTTTYTRAALTLHRAPAMESLLEEVHAALALADETGVHVWDEILCGLGVHCAVMLQDRNAAQQMVERMGRSVSPERKQGLAFFYYISAWAALACGATAEARALIAKAMILYAETGYEFPSNVAYYGAAIICAEHGELDTALAYAQQADAVAAKYQALAMRHSTLLTLAYVQLRRGERAAALTALAEALRIGRAGGYYLTLWWWHAPMMSALAELALHEGIEVDHVIELVRRLKLTSAEPATAPETWPWSIRINTLGPFKVTIDGQPLDSGKKPGQKPLALLKLLAASSAEGLAATQMADLLWPQSEGDKAHHALEMALHRARKMVGSDEALLVRNGWLQLNPALCRVDSHAFTVGVDAGLRALQQGRPDEARRTLERALALYQGHLLAGDRYAERVAPSRERLWNRYLVALERLCALYESTGQIEQALHLYHRACELDELAEALCRHYLRYCLQLGRREEALRAYTRLERAMQQTLGRAPAAATRALLDPVSGE